MHFPIKPAFWLSLLSLTGISAPLAANELAVGTEQTVAQHQRNIASQQRIDQMDAEQKQALQEYLDNQRSADITESYNQQLEKLVHSQKSELADLQRQIASLDETELAVLPMLSRMLDSLSRFVAQDLPFLPQERSQRIERLQKLVDRADVSVAEKYRQILEAYLIEVEYGRTIEAYSGSLDNQYNLGKQAAPQVTYFRLGRTALYYQTLNGQQGAMWQPDKASWQPLDDAQNQALGNAILVAKQQRVPELLHLPLPEVTN
jgi:hypothetical protein